MGALGGGGRRWRCGEPASRGGGVTLPNCLYRINNSLPLLRCSLPPPPSFPLVVELPPATVTSQKERNTRRRRITSRGKDTLTKYTSKPGYQGMRGSRSPAQTDTPVLHSRASFPRPCPPPHQVPVTVLPISLLFPKPCGASPRPTPTLGGIGDRRLACSVPRVQPALSCRCPSRSKRPRHVGPHKRPPTSGPPQLPLLPTGVPGPRSGARGQLLGVGTLLHRGLARALSRVRAGWGRSWGARAHVHPPGRARRGHETRSLRLELQGASEDSAESPTAPLPRPSRQPNSASAREKRNSRDPPLPGAPGPPRCAPHSPPRDPCGPPPQSAAQKEPPNTPGGGSPSPLPWLRARQQWGRRYPSLRAPLAAPDPGGAEQRNKPKVTDLSLQRARALPTEAEAAAAAVASRGGPGAPATRSARRARRAAGRARGTRRRRLHPGSRLGPSGGAPPARRPPRSRSDTAARRSAPSGSFLCHRPD